MSKRNIFFALIIFLFLLTRLYKIASLPGSVYWDEASIGYNAYAIGTDLKDEWGETLPLHFRAFGEFKLPVYIYSVVPFVKIFGLNALAVRLTAVLYSLGTIIVVYLLTKKITGKENISLAASFILTVSPWFFIFSRTGYEATAGVFFFLLGTYLFLLIDKNRLNTIFGTIAFILSFYSYNSFRFLIPIWLLVLFGYYLWKLKDKRKFIWVGGLSVILFILSLVPLYRLYKYDSGGVRFAQVGIKSGSEFVKNYFANFSPQFLFTRGDRNPRSQIPGHGQLFFVDIPLIIIGLYAMLRKKSFLYFIPLIFLLIAPIPAALTKESPHALRSLLSAPAFAMTSAIAIIFLSEKLRKYSGIIIACAIVAYYLSFEAYAQDFVIKYENLSASDWQYQYKKIFSNQISGTVTDEYGQPYIFALFYQKTPPSEFRSTVKYNPPDKWGFSLVSSFNGYQFK